MFVSVYCTIARQVFLCKTCETYQK